MTNEHRTPKPPIPIVNERDEVIGLKDREAITPDDRYRVAASWVCNTKGEFLLARRSLAKSHDPGKWGPSVAGTVEEGETYESNIQKETEEELGLRDVAFVPLDKEFLSVGYRYFCQWFLAQTDQAAEAFRIQADEVIEVKWFSVSELRKRAESDPNAFLPSVRLWVDRLDEIAKKGSSAQILAV